MSERTTSASGAYMSQYDQEVEKRLKSLEATVKKLQEENEQLKKKSSSAKAVAAPAASADLEQKVRVLEYVLKAVEPNFDKLANKA
jgi:cell division protein FtsB